MSPVSAYRMRRGARRVLHAMVNVVQPATGAPDEVLTDRVLAVLERDLGRFPRPTRLLMLFSLWLLEWCGWLYGGSPIPLSRLSYDDQKQRIERYSECPGVWRRTLFKAWKVHILLICYGQPEVQARFGVDELAWRADRRALRDRLVQRDALRAAPPVPEPLGTFPILPPDAVLIPGASARTEPANRGVTDDAETPARQEGVA